MSEITVDIDDYLSEEDKKELVKEAFIYETRSRIDRDFIDTYLKNMAYDIVHEDVEKIIPDFDKKLRDGVAKVVGDVTSYIVFSYKDDSHGRKVINQAVDANAGIIQAKVAALVEEFTEYDVGEMVSDHIRDTINEALRKV